MKEEELNLENIKSKIKKFKWINRIQIIVMCLLFLLGISNPNKNIATILLTILVLITPICIIAISIIHNKIYKLELFINKTKYESEKLNQKIKEDNARINNILENEELMNKLKEKIKSDEEHKN